MCFNTESIFVSKYVCKGIKYVFKKKMFVNFVGKKPTGSEGKHTKHEKKRETTKRFTWHRVFLC